MDDALLLPVRASVSSDIAYLRSSHPANGWATHANYGQLTAFWLHVHQNLRLHGTHLQKSLDTFRQGPSDPQRLGREFASDLNEFYQHLNGHHQIEDHAYFPKFRAIDLRMGAAFDMLESDHAIIHGGIERSVQGARRLLASLTNGNDALRFAADAFAGDQEYLMKLLVRHLADEEEIVIPAMLEHGERSVM